METAYGIRIHPCKLPNSAVDAKLITDTDIVGNELCANNTSVTDDEVKDGTKEYGIAQWCAGKNRVQQVVCCGTVAGKSLCTVIQDTVWSGANLQNSITKEKDDVLWVIYSYELGNAKTAHGTITRTCGCDCQ
jgi:hypothetical protein